MADPFHFDPSQDPLMQTLGFVRVVEADPDAGRICIEYEARQSQCHSGDTVQGGFVSGWIDNAMALAVMLGSNFKSVALSLDLKIAFYRAANPGIVVAEGWVEVMGRRTAFAEGLLRTREGDIIAKGMSTIALKPVAR